MAFFLGFLLNSQSPKKRQINHFVNVNKMIAKALAQSEGHQ